MFKKNKVKTYKAKDLYVAKLGIVTKSQNRRNYICDSSLLNNHCVIVNKFDEYRGKACSVLTEAEYDYFHGNHSLYSYIGRTMMYGLIPLSDCVPTKEEFTKDELADIEKIMNTPKEDKENGEIKDAFLYKLFEVSRQLRGISDASRKEALTSELETLANYYAKSLIELNTMEAKDDITLTLKNRTMVEIECFQRLDDIIGKIKLYLENSDLEKQLKLSTVYLNQEG